MFEQQQQHFVDLHENGSGFVGDPKSWLSGVEEEDQFQSQSLSSAPSLSNGNGSNFDKVLYKNLVEMVPLVESLMDRRANTSFTRRASLICTKTPSRDSIRKIGETKGRKTAQSIPAKKRRDLGDNDINKNACADEFSIFSSRASTIEKDREELVMLQEQVENLEKKLLEKDELLKSTVASMDQMSSVQEKLDELKRQAGEKDDALMRSVHLQLSDAKIKLADKQAALEKLQWEATTYNRKAEKLQEDLDSMEGELSSFMLLLEHLSKNDSIPYAEDYDTSPYNFDQLPYLEDMDEMKLEEMEEARDSYISAVATAKEQQDEESLATAAKARLRLQSFVFGSKI